LLREAAAEVLEIIQGAAAQAEQFILKIILVQQ
jgi:hypothetical protein